MVCLSYMKNKHTIKLSKKEQRQLHNIIRRGTHNARIVTRARILLKSQEGYTDKVIGEHTGASRRTIQRIRKRYHAKGLEYALREEFRPGAPEKLNPKAEARLVAIACSSPPEGTHHWTLELLRERLMKEKVVSSITKVAIWYRLKERGIKPWREKNVVYSKDNARVH